MATARQATQAAQMHAEELSAYPNVVAVGTRPIDDDTSATIGGAEAGHAVAVYVSRKVPVEQLDDQARLPTYVEVPGPGGIDRVPVVVVESGAIEPESGNAASARDKGFTSE